MIDVCTTLNFTYTSIDNRIWKLRLIVNKDDCKIFLSHSTIIFYIIIVYYIFKYEKYLSIRRFMPQMIQLFGEKKIMPM